MYMAESGIGSVETFFPGAAAPIFDVAIESMAYVCRPRHGSDSDAERYHAHRLKTKTPNSLKAPARREALHVYEVAKTFCWVLHGCVQTNLPS